MKYFLIFIGIIVISACVFFWLVVMGIPQPKIESLTIISQNNIVNGVSYNFCTKEVQFPYYHIGYKRTTVSEIKLYSYLENTGNNMIENLDFIPLDLQVFYAKYHSNIKKWVVLSCSIDPNLSGGIGYKIIHMYSFSNKSVITKNVFDNYSLANSMKLDYEVDQIENKVLYYDKDHQPQKFDIK